jgi:hypothetical protein
MEGIFHCIIQDSKKKKKVIEATGKSEGLIAGKNNKK